MDELQWLGERARRHSARREPELSAQNLAALEREHGLEAALERRREVGIQLSGECFRSGLFDEAARWFRQRLTATQQLADHLAQTGDEEGAQREVEELARHAWAVGDLALLMTFTMADFTTSGWSAASRSAICTAVRPASVACALSSRRDKAARSNSKSSALE